MLGLLALGAAALAHSNRPLRNYGGPIDVLPPSRPLMIRPQESDDESNRLRPLCSQCTCHRVMSAGDTCTDCRAMALILRNHARSY